MARPRKEIDKKDFESLLAIQCTQEEIKAFSCMVNKTFLIYSAVVVAH